MSTASVGRKRIAGAICALIAFIVAAQASELVTTSADAAQRTRLAGYVPAWATTTNDVGRVADAVPLERLSIVLRRPSERQNDLETFLAAQQDPASPDFHHWLTPIEFGERFGADTHDIDAVIGWLAAQHLQVDTIANGRTRIAFSGSVAAVNAAFDTELRSYAVDNAMRYAPAREPAVPAAFAGVIDGIFGLHTIPDRPFHGIASATQPAFGSIGFVPDATFCSGTCHYVFPGDFTAIYDLGSLYRQGADGRARSLPSSAAPRSMTRTSRISRVCRDSRSRTPL